MEGFDSLPKTKNRCKSPAGAVEIAKKIRENHSVGSEEWRRNSVKLIEGPPGNVKVLILLLPSTLPKNCKKTRENDSVGSENVVEILSNRIIENAEILACKKIT